MKHAIKKTNLPAPSTEEPKQPVTQEQAREQAQANKQIIELLRQKATDLIAKKPEKAGMILSAWIKNPGKK